jgi:CDGSH-type Zn-finger protein
MEKKPETKIEIKPNGPLVLCGQLEITLSDGQVKHLERVVICRCGQSGKMPYCDASHNRVGFQVD